MKKTLEGTIENFSSNCGNIKADDGDWYGFESKLKFKEGDRVKFDPEYSSEALDIAMIGGPIPCSKVRHI